MIAHLSNILVFCSSRVFRRLATILVSRATLVGLVQCTRCWEVSVKMASAYNVNVISNMFRTQ
jgi:hypothetical protein